MNNNLKYPNPRRMNQIDDFHWAKIHDPYRWMENLNDPELKKWIEDENNLTQTVLDTIPEQNIFKESLEELQNYPQQGMPYIRNGKEFYFKNDGTQDQFILYAKENATLIMGSGTEMEPLKRKGQNSCTDLHSLFSFSFVSLRFRLFASCESGRCR